MAKQLWAGVLVGLMTLPFVGCAGAGDDQETCLTYACVNGTYLRTTLEVAAEVGAIDIRYCEGSVCREGSVDLRASASLECMSIDPASVCLSLQGTQLEINAGWVYGESAHEPKDGTAYQLVVSDHATGDVLLDEKRTAKFKVTREDNCHRCWGAELTPVAQ